MQRYYFHLHSRSGVVIDEEGADHPTSDAAIVDAHRAARAIVGLDVASGTMDLVQRIVVSTADGDEIAKIAFADALRFQYPEDEAELQRCRRIRDLAVLNDPRPADASSEHIIVTSTLME